MYKATDFNKEEESIYGLWLKLFLSPRVQYNESRTEIKAL